MANVKNIDSRYNVLLALVDGEKRFSQLLKESKKAYLAKELNELQNLRYVERTVDDKAKPPATSYRITAIGKKFVRDSSEYQVTKIELQLMRLKKLIPARINQLRKNL